MSISPITGNLTFPFDAAALTDVAGIETLTIPITTEIIVNVGGLGISGEPSPLELSLSGQIVATATIGVPEISPSATPSLFILLTGILRLLTQRGKKLAPPLKR